MGLRAVKLDLTVSKRSSVAEHWRHGLPRIELG